MKDQNNITKPMLIAVIIALLIVLGVYINKDRKASAPVSPAPTTSGTVTTPTVPATSAKSPAVAPSSQSPTTYKGPTIRVVTPNGGETWKQYGSSIVRWASTGLAEKDEIRIAFRKADGSVCWARTTTIDQRYAEFVPDKTFCQGATTNLKSGGSYKVQIVVSKYDSGRGVSDQSDGYFTILDK